MKNEPQQVDRVTRMIGGYFAQRNGIVNPNDEKIVYKNNAEVCYQSWQTIRLYATIALVSGILLMTVVILDSVMKLNIRSVSENFMAVGIDVLIVAMLFWWVIRIKKIRKTPNVQMALKWSRYRKTLRYFAERIDLLQIGEHDERWKDVDHFLYLASKELVHTTLEKKYNTHSDTHPKEDKLVSDLDQFASIFGRFIHWKQNIDEVRDKLGFNG